MAADTKTPPPVAVTTGAAAAAPAPPPPPKLTAETLNRQLTAALIKMGFGLVCSDATDAALVSSMSCYALPASRSNASYFLRFDHTTELDPQKFFFQDGKLEELKSASAEKRRATVIDVDVLADANVKLFIIKINAFRTNPQSQTGIERLLDFIGDKNFGKMSDEHDDGLSGGRATILEMRESARASFTGIAGIPMSEAHEKAPENYDPIQNPDATAHTEPELKAYYNFRETWVRRISCALMSMHELNLKKQAWSNSYCYMMLHVVREALLFASKNNAMLAVMNAGDRWPLQWNERVRTQRSIDITRNPFKTNEDTAAFFAEFAPAPCHAKNKLNVLAIFPHNGVLHVSFHPA